MSYFNYFKAHDQFMPRHLNFSGGGGIGRCNTGNVSITENINIKNGPSGFWGFMSGLSQGLFGGGMGCGMGMGMGSIFGCSSMPMSDMGMGMPMTGMGMPMMGMGMPMMGMSPYAMLNGAVTPQGISQVPSQEASQPNAEDKSLKALIQVHGANYEIVSHPTKEGVYQAHPKKGGELIEGSYDEVMKACTEAKNNNEA